MTKYHSFSLESFRRSVKHALEAVERVLDSERKPKPAEDVDHTYEDKFGLAELIINTAIISTMNGLGQIGLSPEILKQQQLEEGSRTKTKTLRFQAKRSSSLVKTQMVELPNATSLQTTTTTTGLYSGTREKTVMSKIIKNVEEYHFKVDVEWEISLYSGTDVDSRVVLQTRSASKTITTQRKNNPHLVSQAEFVPIEMPLTWILRQIDPNTMAAQFVVDRHDPKTRTPRRNEQVEDALEFFEKLEDWMAGVRDHFKRAVQSALISQHNPVKAEIIDDGLPPEDKRDLVILCSPDEVFCPIIPIMEETTGKETTGNCASAISLPVHKQTSLTQQTAHKPVLLPNQDISLLINEQIRSLEEKLDSLSKNFRNEASNDLISIQEAELMVNCHHIGDLVKATFNGVAYIEGMLESQLIAAIGKEVGQKELDEFVKFHNTKLLTVPPKSFCRNVRRPGYYPEGVLSITQKESELGPVDMMTREIPSSQEISVPINASTSLNLSGNVFLHGWLRSRFGLTYTEHELNARARQFSSFVLMVGTMCGPTSFKPQHAIIVQNKDEVIIPLILEEIPSAKEFKDAIQSLSPEMQQFAKSFRNMQLSSSVFGVCIVQIKPQLERLLGLPDGSLTKEIKLTQDLMELFVEYQVPSDLFTYDATESTERTTLEMVGVVKRHVDSVMDVISSTRQKQLKEKEDEAAAALLRAKAEAEVLEWEAAAESAEIYLRAEGKKVRRLKKSKKKAKSRDVSTDSSIVAKKEAEILVVEPLSNTPAPETDEVADIAVEEMREESQGRPDTGGADGNNETHALDFTNIPKDLDSIFEKYDKNGAICSNTVKIGTSWKRSRQENLLSGVKQTMLDGSAVSTETNKAYDLLDALSRSGSLSIPSSELHVIVSATHRFDKSVMGTLIEDNVNPIEQLEKSTVLFASTIYGRQPADVIQDKETFHHLITNDTLHLSSYKKDDNDEENL